MPTPFLPDYPKLDNNTLKIKNIFYFSKPGTVLEMSIPKLGLPGYRWLPSIYLGIGINRCRRLKLSKRQFEKKDTRDETRYGNY